MPAFYQDKTVEASRGVMTRVVRELRSSALHGHVSVHRLLEVRLHGLGPGRQGQAAPGSVPAGLCEGL